MADATETTSIFDTIKAMLGVTETAFDAELIAFINAAISEAGQLGVGPVDGYEITDTTETWGDLLGDPLRTSMVKTFIYYNVRLGFDPPLPSVITSWEKIIDRLAFRLVIACDPRTYLDPEATNAFVWLLEEDGRFPLEAAIGDVGFNPTNRKIWRKSAP